MASLPLNFILLSFGEKLEYHSQANFVFLTAKKFSPLNSKFIIYTDHPEFYSWGNSFLDVRSVSKAQQEEWIGSYGYFYRVKLMAMLDSASRDPGHIIYLDTDTIVTKDLSSLQAQLDDGKCFMHLKENLLCKDRAIDKMELWEKTKGRSYSGVLVNDKTSMWNSGLVAIPQQLKHELLSKSLDANDEMCRQNIECRVKEQFALGIILESTQKLFEGDEWVLRYWGNKEEWSFAIYKYFAKIFQKNLDPETAAQQLDIEDWCCLPINRYKRTMARRLARWSKTYWDDVVQLYVK